MEKVPCPCCRSLSLWKDNPYRPFCSESCKNRDLGKWANEEYRMPAEEVDPFGANKEIPKEKREED